MSQKLKTAFNPAAMTEGKQNIMSEGILKKCELGRITFCI